MKFINHVRLKFDMKAETKESFKIGLFLTLITGWMLFGAYMVGTGVKSKIAEKQYLDSLKIENLKLTLELKKHKLQ